MEEPNVGEAKRRIVDCLKRSSGATASEIAAQLGLTSVAVRQHLQALEELGLLTRQTIREDRRGRPSLGWTLTAAGHRLFPDRHDELTVELLSAMRRALGDDGLDRVVAERARQQIREYRRELPPASASLRKRVEALARRRTAEGYMAEVIEEGPGTVLLVEHHCPIGEAARACSGFCAAELEVFRESLGSGVRVERTSHVLEGDERCAYRVEKRRRS